MESSVTVSPIGANVYQITVEIPDFIGLLSVVTGLFSSYGMSIQQAKIETIHDRAVDVFEVIVEKAPDWEQFKKDLSSLSERARKGERNAVRTQIHRKIIQYLRIHKELYVPRLAPIDLAIDQALSPFETVVTVRTQDTFAFLYELTNALALLDINIVRMDVRTVEGKVEDRLWLTYEGEKIVSEEKLRAIQWAVLLVKQFTHLLPKVPDPFSALEQFASFGKDMLPRSDFSNILLSLKNPEVLERLSKVLGTSRFLWEEFIRLQYESIIPIFERAKVSKKKTRFTLERELERLLYLKKTFAEKADALNEFKDREMFRIDLRHILGMTSYLGEFAQEFTWLVEAVVAVAFRMIWEEMLKQWPPPMISNDERSELAVFALGKFGGEELGYASDVELLFVYTDDPDSTSVRSQANLKFYLEFVRLFRGLIRARAEGVFEIDLRLRPYGKEGLLAVSLPLFRKYYSQTGDAWNFERQALVKLRYVAGSETLGRDVERLHDDFVYSEKPFDFKEVMRLRKRQHSELAGRGTLNAKYSPGGLLDIEYLIQSLQVTYGRTRRGEIRSPNTLKALRALWQEGVMTEPEFQSLRACYIFLRSLINALRILRGNAKDLTVPEEASEEFSILARRMGYQGEDPAVEKQLAQDLNHFFPRSAQFFESWIKALESREWATLAASVTKHEKALRVSLDDLLRGEISTEDGNILQALGFRSIRESVDRFKRICPKAPAFETFARVMDRAWPVWSSVGDPDLAVRNLERLREAAPEETGFWSFLAGSETGVSILLRLFGSSIYLSEIFISHPETWNWIRDPSCLTLSETHRCLKELKDRPSRPEDLVHLRQTETLRIALAGQVGSAPWPEVYGTFSDLADFIVEDVCRRSFEPGECCVIGLGKLGGRELNFSSDIDLMFLSVKDAELQKKIQEFLKWMRGEGADDFLYRVDLRLRPHGHHGSLFLDQDQYLHYYQNEGDVWEFQALIKARPVGGNKALGRELIRSVEPLIYRKDWSVREIERLREIKHRFEAMTHSRGESETHVKMGSGGIRDIEFSVQMIQLMEGHGIRSLREVNTLRSLDQIRHFHLIPESDCEVLQEGYLFLRQIENYLQLYENRQEFNLPQAKEKLRALSRNLGFTDDVQGLAEDHFSKALNRTRQNCRAIFERIWNPS